MSITNRLIELKILLDEVLPPLVIENVLEEGEWDGLSKTQQETAELYFDAAIALMEQKIEARIRKLEKRGLSERGEGLQKRVTEIGDRVGIMLHPDLTYILIVSSIYSNAPQHVTSNMGRAAIKSTLDVIMRDWDKKK